MGRRIVFPRIWPARAVASRTLPVTLQPIDQIAVPGPLPGAGGFRTSAEWSGAIMDGEGMQPGRAFLGNTEADLNSGAAPDRINRGTTARNAGKIGPANMPGGIGGWPYDGNALLVPHTMIPRRPITVTPFARTIDTGVTIPSQAIGDPI